MKKEELHQNNIDPAQTKGAPAGSSENRLSGSDSDRTECPVADSKSVPQATEEQDFSWRPRDFKRWLLAGLGLICVGLGALGTIVPGLPTTIFVIIAAWSFSKSCPWLEQRLLRNKMFGPSMEIIDGKRPFTRKARTIAMSMMFFFGFTSIGFLHYTAAVQQYVLVIIFLALIAGAISIVMYKPGSTNANLEDNVDAEKR